MHQQSLFLATPQAAQYLNLSPRTMERWRVQGIGPKYRKFGRRTLYNRRDLDIWADQQTRSSTSNDATAS